MLRNLINALKEVCSETKAEVQAAVSQASPESFIGKTVRKSEANVTHFFEPKVVLKIALTIFYVKTFLRKLLARVKASDTWKDLNQPFLIEKKVPKYRLLLSNFWKAYCSMSLLIIGVFWLCIIGIPFITKISFGFTFLLSSFLLIMNENEKVYALS